VLAPAVALEAGAVPSARASACDRFSNRRLSVAREGVDVELRRHAARVPFDARGA
jgi:hypothetical protein